MPVITKPNLHFDATTYTGTDGVAGSVTGVGFQPDFVWGKRRSVNASHTLYDAVRGATKEIYSDLTNAEGTNSNGLTAFNSDGFSYGVSSALSQGSIVAWCWKANGAGSTNTAGSITSQVSANPTAGFSVFTFNSGASGTQTVGHGLGAYPGMVIFKDRGVSGYWSVWHSAFSNPAQSYMYLDLTNAVGADASQWSNTAPTSSVFTYNSGYSFNANRNMLAYAWAPIAGYSAFGSYTGNGSADGPFVYLGFRPRFVMIKRTDTSGTDWILLDSSRDPTNVVDQYLAANLSDAETVYANDKVDFLSNGFKQRGTASGQNGSGGTFIYMAFAEAPFKYSSAR